MSEPGLRHRKKAATRRSIQEHALRLFLSRGYDATTVTDIAEAADVSPMTFFRYFRTKEDVVEYDEYDPRLVAAIAARPADEGGLRSIGVSVTAALSSLETTELETVLVRTRLVLTTPALRARLRGNHEATQSLLADALARRDGDTGEPGFRHCVVAGAALAVIETALAEWSSGNDPGALVALITAAFGAVTADAARAT